MSHCGRMSREPMFSVIDWGRTRYADATARQLELVQQRIDGTIGDTLVFTEHDPVYTVGLRTGAAAHLVWDETRRSSEGIEVSATNRGGDITYHGPGQLVGYPIMSLDGRRDLHAYLRLLEDVLIDTVASFGVTATQRPGLTGIWIGTRKVAAIGVAVRRWVTYHGFALNVSPNLEHFGGIVPCGIAPTVGSVTSLERECARTPTLAEVQAAASAAFANRGRSLAGAGEPATRPARRAG